MAQISAAAPQSGIVRPFLDAGFLPADKSRCYRVAIEKGDPGTGPSTAILEAKPNCAVPPHYHTAEEQLMIVRGTFMVGMEGRSDTLLGPGGFAMMPGKHPHWFTCQASRGCAMFVTLDRAYDIVWVRSEPNRKR
jgi:quercetin dioxygenase-like cupin family protein